MQKLIAQMQTEAPPGKLLLIPPGSVQGSPLAWHRINVHQGRVQIQVHVLQKKTDYLIAKVTLYGYL